MNSTLQKLAEAYVDTLLEKIVTPVVFSAPLVSDAKEAALEIFRILSSREFTYFTRVKSEPYKEKICKKIENAYNNKKGLFFYFNLGGGYHARIYDGLSFDPGLAELLALFQIKKFMDRISYSFPFGIHFRIIIDNRSAEFANNIPITKTESFTVKLEKLIQDVGLEDNIKLIIESKTISRSDFQERISSLEKDSNYDVSDKDCQNANRFSNDINNSDAEICARKYMEIRNVSRNLSVELSRDGILLTQRDTQNSFPFRSFPGGDSKIQCGKIALLIDKGAIQRPILITSNNIKSFDLVKVDFAKGFAINNLLLASEKGN